MGMDDSQGLVTFPQGIDEIAKGHQIVNLIEVEVLSLHLLVDAVEML